MILWSIFNWLGGEIQGYPPTLGGKISTPGGVEIFGYIQNGNCNKSAKFC